MHVFTMVALDAAAILILTLALYYRRHRRRDLVTAFTVVNVGVFAVSTVLASVEVGLGLGLGLFGVLSIIRLRSDEISQTEIAYYFASLAIGLITGLGTNNAQALITVGLVALVIGAIAVIDSRSLFARSRQTQLRLDRAICDPEQLRLQLEAVLGGTVHSATIVSLDTVNDTTLVDVRWRVGESETALVR